MLSFFTFLFLQATARAEVEVESLGPDLLLVSDPGMLQGDGEGVVYLINKQGELQHHWRAPSDWTHAAEYLPTGEVVVASTGDNRLFRVSANGRVQWELLSGQLSDGSDLKYPNDIDILDNGHYLVSDKENHRILEIDESGHIYWQFGETGVSGNDASHLYGPHNPDRLENGNTIVADSDNNRILEIDPSGNLVWYYWPGATAPLDWPRDADLLRNGNIIISDTFNSQLRIIDRAGNTLNIIPLPADPYEVDELGDGTFLVSCVSPGTNGGLFQVDLSGTVIWQYPNYGNIGTNNSYITNPTSGVDVFVEYYSPDQTQYAGKHPAVIFVPNYAQESNYLEETAKGFAKLGFLSVRYDPDGRGQSTNNGQYVGEDYGGLIHQECLRQVIAFTKSLQQVDSERIVIVAEGYGNIAAIGGLSSLPKVDSNYLLIDIEGPATRAEASSTNGGFIPHHTSDNQFWAPREPLRSISYLKGDYIRLQSVDDEFALGPVNRHAISLINQATSDDFGGNGLANFTRANLFLDNPPNHYWHHGNTPQWIPENCDHKRFKAFNLNAAILEYTKKPTINIGGHLNSGGNILITIEHHGSLANHTLSLAVSNGTSSSPLLFGGWHNLTQNLMFAQTLRKSVLNQSGTTSIGYNIPNNPSLSGRKYYAQAIIRNSQLPIPHTLTSLATFTIN